jgi:hypothetical protein
MNGTSQSRTVVWAGLFACAACAALAVDVPVARWFREGWGLGDVRKMLNLSEVFAHGFGVAMILVVVAVLDPWKRPLLARVATCTFGAGVVAQLAKHLIPRIRPNAFDPPGDVFSSFIPWGVEAQYQAAELGARGDPVFSVRAHGHGGRTGTRLGVAVSTRSLAVFLFCLSCRGTAHYFARALRQRYVRGRIARLPGGRLLSE